jgi:hypothetical protein
MFEIKKQICLVSNSRNGRCFAHEFARCQRGLPPVLIIYKFNNIIGNALRTKTLSTSIIWSGRLSSPGTSVTFILIIAILMCFLFPNAETPVLDSHPQLSRGSDRELATTESVVRSTRVEVLALPVASAFRFLRRRLCYLVFLSRR